MPKIIVYLFGNEFFFDFVTVLVGQPGCLGESLMFPNKLFSQFRQVFAAPIEYLKILNLSHGAGFAADGFRNFGLVFPNIPLCHLELEI